MTEAQPTRGDGHGESLGMVNQLVKQLESAGERWQNLVANKRWLNSWNEMINRVISYKFIYFDEQG